MVTLTAGMPRLRKDDFVFEDETEKEEYKYRKRQLEARKALGLLSFYTFISVVESMLDDQFYFL